jgi:hypothetical protein
MNRLLPLLATGLVLNVCLSGSSAVAQPPPSKAQEEVQQLILDLKELKGLVGGVTDKVLRDRLEKSVGGMEIRLANLQKALAGPVADTTKKAVADTDFQKFLAAVKKEAFDEGKLALVKDFVKGNYFTSSQAAVVVKQFAFSDGQVQSAVALHPRLTDPSNFFEVLGVFTFDSDKAKVRDALKMK